MDHFPTCSTFPQLCQTTSFRHFLIYEILHPVVPKVTLQILQTAPAAPNVAYFLKHTSVNSHPGHLVKTGNFTIVNTVFYFQLLPWGQPEQHI